MATITIVSPIELSVWPIQRKRKAGRARAARTARRTLAAGDAGVVAAHLLERAPLAGPRDAQLDRHLRLAAEVHHGLPVPDLQALAGQRHARLAHPARDVDREA